jgi:hypothetical protein
MLRTIRLTAVAVVVLAATALAFGTTAASAQSPPPLTRTLPITGVAKNGKKLVGTYTISRFTTRAGRLYAVGTLRGTLKHRRIVRRGVRLPAALAGARGAKAAQVLPPTPNACQILNLVLGPIDLNLLGLRVRTNQINALVEGVRGAGNLLGNLLCGITGLLDQGILQGSLSQLSQVLNAILALVPARPTG